MTTLPNMGLVLPTRGPSGAGVWDDTVDDNYGREDAHDHTVGKGVAVPTAGLNINADLTFSSLYAPINLHRITFASIVALSSSNKSLFVSSADNELYWRSNSGTNVKLTSGSALNVAPFAGGIGGDYTAVSAAENFDSSGNRYTFRGAAGTNWARIASGDVRLFETNTTDAVFVGLAAPSALAGSYTITMPLAVPGSTSLVQMDSAGVLTASNVTIGGTPNFTGAVTMGSSLGVTGAVTVGTTLGVTGLVTMSAAATVGTTLGVTGVITATGGLTTAAAAGIVMTSTADLHHPTRTLGISAAAFQPMGINSVAESATISVPARAFTATWRWGANGALAAAIPLRAGDRILSVEVDYVAENNVDAVTVNLLVDNTSFATSTNQGTATQSGLSVKTGSASATTSYTLLTGDAAYIYATSNSANTVNGNHLTMARVTWDRP